MKKRIFSWFLAICMVLTLLPTTVLAAEETPALTKHTAGKDDLEQILVHVSSEA